MSKAILKGGVSATAITLAIGFAAPAFAACVADASHNVTCLGANTTPLTIYDQAAQFQPIAGSNSYTPANPAYPAASNPNNPGYNPDPPTAFVTIDPNATFTTSAPVTAANRGTVLADGGLITANYSNDENPAVNNVTVNNAGTVTVINTQSTGRVSAIVSDSQVNVFTVNNAATGTIAVQSALGATFSSAALQNTASTTTAPTPPTYTARYGNPTTSLAITSSLYSDDNTNSFVVNNDGAITATGHYAAAYYGRADTTIKNTGTLGNTDWAATDHIYDGHWSIATFAGAEFATLAGSNPDTPIYDVKNVAIQNNIYTGTIAVTDTVATTVKNSGSIYGDILVLDTNPLVTAAAAAKGQALPLAVSGSNSGPRDSLIVNKGTIDGSFYLGSGAHVIKNKAGATIAGSINVDQRASVGTFAAAVPGSAAGTYLSTGTGTGANGTACPAAGSNTSDPLCAQTRTVQASFAGDRTFKLKNKGALGGDITINDQPGAVNRVVLDGTGFAGNVVAVNGTGTNTLVLNGVTNLASVQNFTNLNLKSSNVAVAGGVSLVDGATVKTTIYGKGGTRADPSTRLGTINGTLTLAGATTVDPKIATFVRNGDTYQLASAVAGPGAADITVKQSDSALVKTRADTSTGKLLLETQVRDARTIAGISQPAGATLQGLLTYDGNSAAVRALGATVEGLTSDAAVRQAGSALSPIVNGADVQIPINSAMLFHQQIDSRLDNFIFAQIPVSGRSADLGPSHPAPVYGVLPPDGAWLEGIGGGINQGAVNGVSGYNAELEGVIGGYDRLIAPAFRVGGAFGFLNGNVNGNSNFVGNRETIQTYQGLVYGTIEQPNYYLRGSVGYGGVNFQDTRQIAFAGFSDTAQGSHAGDIFTARGEGGVPFEYGASLLVPYAAFTYSHLHQNAYGETSAAGTAFDYRTANNDSERSEVGGKVVVPLVEYPVFATLFPVGSFVALEGRAAYVHEFGNVAQTVAASFVGGGNLFVASGPIPDRDMVDYGVGLRMGSGRWQVDLSYNGLARSTYLQQVGLAKVRYLF